jgi:hypothetical protein
MSVSQETPKLLRSRKAGRETYDDVIRALIVSHPNRPTMAELYRRVREGERRPIEHLARRAGANLASRRAPTGWLQRRVHPPRAQGILELVRASSTFWPSISLRNRLISLSSW